MAQSHTALRAIRGLLGKCQRGSHRERHLPPHPGPLPQVEGESSAGFQHNPARRLPDELPEQPDLPPAVPSPCGRVRVTESACRSTQRLGPFPKLLNLASPPAAPEVSHDNEPRRIIPPCERGPGRVCPSGQVVRRL